jgi:hypothetical protein
MDGDGLAGVRRRARCKQRMRCGRGALEGVGGTSNDGRDHLGALVPSRPLIELCAGSAAVTLALLTGGCVKPPSAYTGSKAGYAQPTLEAFERELGGGAPAVLLNDPGPWGAAWPAFSDHEQHAGVVRRLESWIDTDPKELWTELRAAENQEDVAAWIVLQSWNYACKPAEPGNISFNKAAAYAPDKDGRRGTAKIAHRLEKLVNVPWPDRVVVTSLPAAELEPLEVAAWLGVPELPPLGSFTVGAAPTPWADVYIDPPYLGTMPYAHGFTRAEVLETARRWAAAGTQVCLSEGVPLDVELGAGWQSTEITDRRRGSARTFSRQRREFLTRTCA